VFVAGGSFVIRRIKPRKFMVAEYSVLCRGWLFRNIVEMQVYIP
jgi:hypothetical protein